MKDLESYIEARDNAMLDYPNTKKLEDLVKSYPDYFSPRFKILWQSSTTQTKVRTLELMIEEWTKAPDWLVEKVNKSKLMRGKDNDG